MTVTYCWGEENGSIQVNNGSNQVNNGSIQVNNGSNQVNNGSIQVNNDIYMCMSNSHSVRMFDMLLRKFISDC